MLNKSICLLLFIFLCAKVNAQQNISNADNSTADFKKLDAATKSKLIHQWIKSSEQNECPIDINQKIVSFYKQYNIDERIYLKYKILFKTVTNASLNLKDRINLCYFILENYDPSYFPTIVIKEILENYISILKNQNSR